jgi:hypothetical protein
MSRYVTQTFRLSPEQSAKFLADLAEQIQKCNITVEAYTDDGITGEFPSVILEAVGDQKQLFMALGETLLSDINKKA